jgi:carboxylesterase type B
VRLVATSARLLYRALGVRYATGGVGEVCWTSSQIACAWVDDMCAHEARAATDDTHRCDSMEGRDWPTLTGGKRVLELGVWLPHARPERGSYG